MARKQLYSIKYDAKRETAIKFLDRFEEIVLNYENITSSTSLPDDEKRDALFNAIMYQLPEVQSIDFMTKSQTGKGLDYDLLKMFMVQAEANGLQAANENHPSSKPTSMASVQFLNSQQKKWINERCYECNDYGYLKNECPLKGKGLRKCYECQKLTTHKAFECPQRLAKSREKGRGIAGKRFVSSNDRSNISLHAKNKRQFKNKSNRENKNFNIIRQIQNDKQLHKTNNDSQSQKLFNNKNDNIKFKQRQTRTGTSETPKISFTESQNSDTGRFNQNITPFFTENISTFVTNTTSSIYSYENSDLNHKDSENHNYVSFIVESGATENITNSKDIFDAFDNSKVDIIKCANKDSTANLISEGKGTIRLISNKLKSVELANTIYTDSVSENLLSLRRLAEAGFSTYLDNKCENIFNSKTNELLATGIYEKPYWFLEFQVEKKSLNKKLEISDMMVFDTTVTNEKLERNNEM